MTKLEAKLIGQSKIITKAMCHDRCKHVSFLMVRNKIISLGVNSYQKTSPIAKKFGHRGCFIHSEVAAIVNAGREFDLSRATLYNVRISVAGLARMSRPCPSCQSVLAAFSIRRCYYTTDQGVFERYF